MNKPSSPARSAVSGPSYPLRSFLLKEAAFHLYGGPPGFLEKQLRRLRRELEDYIRRLPGFRTALSPFPLPADPPAPAFVPEMAEAAALTGTGPMAAVAGTMAEAAARTWLNPSPSAGSMHGSPPPGRREVIIENGGDIFASVRRPLTLGLFLGTNPLSGRLALRLQPPQMPLAVCSSSSLMGRSRSFGRCDLATVIAPRAALADAAATAAANRIRTEADLQPAVQAISAIPGITGVLAVKGKKIALARGTGIPAEAMPDLIKTAAPGN